MDPAKARMKDGNEAATAKAETERGVQNGTHAQEVQKENEVQPNDDGATTNVTAKTKKSEDASANPNHLSEEAKKEDGSPAHFGRSVLF